MCETFEEEYLSRGWEGKELQVSRAEGVNQAVRAKERLGGVGHKVSCASSPSLGRYQSL